MAPDRLGRYQVERVLGRGAMGVVYLARDPVIGRQVALKTLTVPDDGEQADEFHERFMREAQAAGILGHPGIVTVHDAGLDEATGLSYIAMEYVEGRSLKEIAAAGHGFTYSEIARVGAAIASALDYAHAKGVVHRDIKPANVLITTQGAVKITDFGVARMDSSNLTATGQFIGTPNYMSPEQITGGIVDGRSDLFSLGVVLFELLTGQRPFLGSSLTEVSYKIVHGHRPIPSQVRPGVPPAFNPIVLKLLERDPERRYNRGDEVSRALDALRRVLTGAPPVEEREVPASPAPPATAESLQREIDASPTATRATELGRGVLGSSIWKRPVAGRWVAILIAAAAAPVALMTMILAVRVDRGPYVAPPPGEAARRHRNSVAQRDAAQALAQGRPETVAETLSAVWDQAPYSFTARRLLADAQLMQSTQSEQRVSAERAAALLDEGKKLLAAGRFQDARMRFDEVQRLVPGNSLAELAKEYSDLATARVRAIPRRTTVERVQASVTPRATAVPTPGTAGVELYFNSPISSGTVEVVVDGESVGKQPFDFSTKGFLGLRKKGTGVVSNDYTLSSGSHRVTVRLFGEDGQLRGEETFTDPFAAGGRYTLKIEMNDERSTPRFSLRPR